MVSEAVVESRNRLVDRIRPRLGLRGAGGNELEKVHFALDREKRGVGPLEIIVSSGGWDVSGYEPCGLPLEKAADGQHPYSDSPRYLTEISTGASGDSECSDGHGPPMSWGSTGWTQEASMSGSLLR
jgi:hypothetical protein